MLREGLVMDEPRTRHPYTRQEALLGFLWLTVLFLWTVAPLAGYDFWFYLAVGRDIVQSGQIPQAQSYLGTTQVFGFGNFADIAWLGNLLCYVVFAAMGPLGLVLLKSSLLTLSTAIVYVANRICGLSPFWAGAWSTLALWTIRGRFEMRTYLFTTVALATLSLLLIYWDKHRSRWVFAGVGLLFILWTNIHQGFIAGYVVLGGWLLLGRAPWRQRVLLFTLALGCGLVRPNMMSLPSFFFHLATNSDPFQGIVEWGAPSVEQRVKHLGLFFLTLGWLAGVSLLRLRQKVRLESPARALVATAFAIMAWRSYRSIAELLPVVCPMVALYFPALPQGPRPKMAVALVLAGLLWMNFDVRQFRHLGEIHGQPARLADLLDRREQVFNSFEFGNFLIYRQIPPFIHGMHALYGQQLVLDFEAVLNPTPRRQEILQRFSVKSALLHHPTEEDATLNLVQTLSAAPDWRLQAWDDTGLLFTKGQNETGLTQVKPWKDPPWDDPHRAEVELHELLQRLPSSLGHLMLSRLLLERGEVTQALSQATLATQLRPDFALAWSQLGACYAKAGNLSGVLMASRKVVALAPNLAQSHRNLALALSESSRRQGGIFRAWHGLLARFHAVRAQQLTAPPAP